MGHARDMPHLAADADSSQDAMAAEGAAGSSHHRTFAAAFLGHALDGTGETQCNFRVTHLASGISWWVRRGLREWSRLESQLKREAAALPQLPSGTLFSSRGSGSGGGGGTLVIHGTALPLAPRNGAPGESAASTAVARKGSGSSTSAVLQSGRRQRELEQLQARLSEMLWDVSLQRCAALHQFLGIRPPDVPSLVRIAKLQPDPTFWRREDGDAALIQGLVEVRIREFGVDMALKEPPALPTHVVASVNVIVVPGGANGSCTESGELVNIAEHVAPVHFTGPVEILLSGLRPTVFYEFEVYAENAVGRSSSIRIRVLIPPALTLQPAAPQAAAPSPRLRVGESTATARTPDGQVAEPSGAADQVETSASSKLLENQKPNTVDPAQFPAGGVGPSEGSEAVCGSATAPPQPAESLLGPAPGEDLRRNALETAPSGLREDSLSRLSQASVDRDPQLAQGPPLGVTAARVVDGTTEAQQLQVDGFRAAETAEGQLDGGQMPGNEKDGCTGPEARSVPESGQQCGPPEVAALSHDDAAGAPADAFFSTASPPNPAPEEQPLDPEVTPAQVPEAAPATEAPAGADAVPGTPEASVLQAGGLKLQAKDKLPATHAAVVSRDEDLQRPLEAATLPAVQGALATDDFFSPTEATSAAVGSLPSSHQAAPGGRTTDPAVEPARGPSPQTRTPLSVDGCAAAAEVCDQVQSPEGDTGLIPDSKERDSQRDSQGEELPTGGLVSIRQSVGVPGEELPAGLPGPPEPAGAGQNALPAEASRAAPAVAGTGTLAESVETGEKRELQEADEGQRHRPPEALVIPEDDMQSIPMDSFFTPTEFASAMPALENSPTLSAPVAEQAALLVVSAVRGTELVGTSPEAEAAQTSTWLEGESPCRTAPEDVLVADVDASDAPRDNLPAELPVVDEVGGSLEAKPPQAEAQLPKPPEAMQPAQVQADGDALVSPGGELPTVTQAATRQEALQASGAQRVAMLDGHLRGQPLDAAAAGSQFDDASKRPVEDVSPATSAVPVLQQVAPPVPGAVTGATAQEGVQGSPKAGPAQDAELEVVEAEEGSPPAPPAATMPKEQDAGVPADSFPSGASSTPEGSSGTAPVRGRSPDQEAAPPPEEPLSPVHSVPPEVPDFSPSEGATASLSGSPPPADETTGSLEVPEASLSHASSESWLAAMPRHSDPPSQTAQGCEAGWAEAIASTAPVPGAPPQAPLAPRRAAPRPGFKRLCGFDVLEKQLPLGTASVDIEALAAELRQAYARAGGEEISAQQSLRLLMGMDLDCTAALERAEEVRAWRRQHGMRQVRATLQTSLAESGIGKKVSSIQLPHHEEVCQLFVVNPCCLTTADGRPISIWHVGSAQANVVSKIKDEALSTWSRATFEYVDLWLSQQSESTGTLAGHVQIFNLTGLGFRHCTNSALIEKLKLALGAGGKYVEVVSHIYVVNSSSLFSMAWKVVKNLITPRTASKITVTASALPDELLQELGGSQQSARQLTVLLEKAHASAAVLLPPEPALAQFS